MLQTRVIPCLLLKDEILVKTIQFNDTIYIGDPINTVRIFNENEVDELILLNIMASRDKKMMPINENKRFIEFISNISYECFMPLTYGGGIRSLEDIKELLNAGVEKVSINTSAIENPSFIESAANTFGSQSIVISIDVKKHKETTICE